MLDVKRIRQSVDEVKAALIQRGDNPEPIEQFLQLDVQRREKLQQVEALKSERNSVSQQIARMKKAGEPAENRIAEMKQVSDQIKLLDDEVRSIDEQISELLLTLPNIPHNSVPVGQDEDENVVVRHWKEVPRLTFEPQAHWDIAESLKLLNFEAAAKVTGSRFVFYTGLGARLERALIQFMMDLHSDEHGYLEMLPPMMINRESMTGTGQLPKFEEDAFKIEESDYYLAPTSEVPVTNYHRDEILQASDLPKYYVAYSACFRSEAGSAGRDTRGLIRQHQFNKVELVKLSLPEESYDELEKLTANAEKVLQLLELPYRVVSLCTGDLGFSSAKTYDLEVWLPHSNMYREISSCSNFEDFQARRANIRFRRDKQSKPEFVHTLNGSGLAIGRTVAAIIENYQQEDGTVIVPKVLRAYMNGREQIG